MVNLLVRCEDKHKEALIVKGIEKVAEVTWVDEIDACNITAFEAIFDLLFTNESLIEIVPPVPVFINEVAITNKALPSNYVRLNAWPGFLENNLVEVVAGTGIKNKAQYILNTLGWKFIWAPDEPGMISAKIISMIINEAFYALEENISTREEIDIAMKLGTNYPYGPFEWSDKIGLKEIYRVLVELSKKDKRYTICSLLRKQAEAAR